MIKPPCPICRVPEKDKHSLREAGRCAALKRQARNEKDFVLADKHKKPIRHENTR